MSIEEIPVLRGDIVSMAAAIKAAYYMSVAQDMADNYKKLDNRGQSSAITKLLEEALTKAEAYEKEITDDQAG